MCDRFRREARAAAALTHPNICQVLDVGEHEGAPFIILELLAGESLADRLLRRPLPPGEAITIALGALNGLDALHRQGLTHRDIKPTNLFVTPHGLKILDFGLARLLPVTDDPQAAETRLTITRPGVLLGTPAYMAPERVEGREAGPPAGIFAFGAVFFEMLAENRHSWENDDGDPGGRAPVAPPPS